MRAGILAVLVLASCGGGVQQATLTPPSEAAQPKSEGDRGARVSVEPSRSRIVVAARDITRKSHPLRFEKFHGTLNVDREGGGGLELAIDTPTLRAENGFAENLAHAMLEVERFPQATLVAKLEPGDAADTRVVKGNVMVHGVERGIAFRAKVRREGDAWRLSATFDMSRSAFGIKADGAWDPLIRDEFRVTFDLRGAPEAKE